MKIKIDSIAKHRVAIFYFLAMTNYFVVRFFDYNLMVCAISFSSILIAAYALCKAASFSKKSKLN